MPSPVIQAPLPQQRKVDSLYPFLLIAGIVGTYALIWRNWYFFSWLNWLGEQSLFPPVQTVLLALIWPTAAALAAFFLYKHAALQAFMFTFVVCWIALVFLFMSDDGSVFSMMRFLYSMGIEIENPPTLYSPGR